METFKDDDITTRWYSKEKISKKCFVELLLIYGFFPFMFIVFFLIGMLYVSISVSIFMLIPFILITSFVLLIFLSHFLNVISSEYIVTNKKIYSISRIFERSIILINTA